MSESTSKDDTNTKIITFNGKKRDWDPWEEKFLARAKRRGYKHILLGKETIPDSSEILDESKDTDKPKIKIRELNETAYGDLVTAMDTSKPGGLVAFGLIKGSKSLDYADGNAQVAWSRLQRKYAPKTAPSLSKMHKQFYSAKLKKKQDPDEFITNLEDTRSRMEAMKSTMSDDQFMMHIMNNLTSDYSMDISKLEKKNRSYN
jgi:hypothetical protein